MILRKELHICAEGKSRSILSNASVPSAEPVFVSGSALSHFSRALRVGEVLAFAIIGMPGVDLPT